MHRIEVDDEIMAYLASHAVPFIDTPNSVLRTLLLNQENRDPPPTDEARTMHPTSIRPHRIGSDKHAPDSFVADVLGREFGERFKVRTPYQMMFESEQRLVYFQNFNKSGTNNLWFRLNLRPMQVLRSSRKPAFVCLTNPADRYAFLIPLKDLDAHVQASDWTRPELEVNIDPSTLRWREFNWDLSSYRKQY